MAALSTSKLGASDSEASGIKAPPSFFSMARAFSSEFKAAACHSLMVEMTLSEDKALGSCLTAEIKASGQIASGIGFSHPSGRVRVSRPTGAAYHETCAQQFVLKFGLPPRSSELLNVEWTDAQPGQLSSLAFPKMGISNSRAAMRF